MSDDPELLAAQRERDMKILDYDVSQILDRAFSASDVIGTEARDALAGVLRVYAQDPHPYRTCVAQNIARFGPGKTERVCGTIKDMIKSTTRWRHDFSDVDNDTCRYTPTDTERAEIFASLSDDDWAALEEVVLHASEAR